MENTTDIGGFTEPAAETAETTSATSPDPFTEGFSDDSDEPENTTPVPDDPSAMPPDEIGDEADDTDNTDDDTGTENPTFPVVYNGEKYDLTVSDLIQNAQKGMNYDKIHHSLEQANAQLSSMNDTLSVFQKIADQNGVSMEEFAHAVSQQPDSCQMQTPPEDENQMYRDLVDAYPDISEVPEEVARAVSNGENVLSAYRAYENKRLRQEISALQTNHTNFQKSPGSMLGNAGDEGFDSFLAGFNH